MIGRARRAAPVPLADIVNRAFHRHGWSRSTSHTTVFSSWETILPAEWRERCRPVSFRAGRLIVAVDSSPLLEDMRMFRGATLLGLLNEAIRASGRLPIVEVRALDFRRS
ncbi:MAG: DUF721 domain-containing protein [Planctomycetota bacterium]|nr:DUF721 domain-containing protein [Planctomycetota bacterium]